MNISTGTSLSYNDTDIIKAELFNFFVLYGPAPTQLRAYEIIMHWCVNTYNVTVQNNVPITQQVASYTKPNLGEVFVGLSIITLLIVIIQTAGLDIEIVKGSPLPAFLAMNPDEKTALMREQQEMDMRDRDSELQIPHLRAHGIVGGLERRGEEWGLRSSDR
ncbi:hypothetical protein COL922a_009048 [Colletotrichum nupharicola]|nr:hypothetical protein COL922a_009048 [Colletotrichum nupharicola]